MADNVIELTDATFDEAVTSSKEPVLVDFWAPWCGPCKMITPIIEEIADEYEGKAKICKVNTDEDPEHAQQFGVQGIPTMIFMSDGKLVHRQVGALQEPMLRDLFEQFINLASTPKEQVN